jgi:hypothetical protein
MVGFCPDLFASSNSLIRDRRKLTFYFVADKRIDFRELVRELFRCALGHLRDIVWRYSPPAKVVQNENLDGLVARSCYL